MITVLLTASIDPQGATHTIRTDPVIRHADYLNSLRRWLNVPYPFRLLFLENTGADLSALRRLVDTYNPHRKAVQVLSCSDNSSARLLGKGYSEATLIKTAFERGLVQPLGNVLKVSGRYFLLNATRVLASIDSNPTAVVHCHPCDSGPCVVTSVICARADVLVRYLLRDAALINDNEGMYIEHIVARGVKLALGEGLNVVEFSPAPMVVGVSASYDATFTGREMLKGHRRLRRLNYLKERILNKFAELRIIAGQSRGDPFVRIRSRN